jgi:hypothetical protein
MEDLWHPYERIIPCLWQQKFTPISLSDEGIISGFTYPLFSIKNSIVNTDMFY